MIFTESSVRKAVSLQWSLMRKGWEPLLKWNKLTPLLTSPLSNEPQQKRLRSCQQLLNGRDHTTILLHHILG